jgi:hypothetical protein
VPEEAKESLPIPPLDAREDLARGMIYGAFAPEGLCHWCDNRHRWAKDHQPAQPKVKRAVRRKKRALAAKAETPSAST